MKHINVKPGDVVVTNLDLYQHWSLVSDNVCEEGKPMLISASRRNGTVKEESWDVVTKGKHTYVANIEAKKPLLQVLESARSQIDKWKYTLTDTNCEHFVKWATDLEVSSTQVIAGVGGAAVGVAAVGMLSENPTLLKLLGGAILTGGLAVATAKAVKKSHSNQA